MGNELEKKDGRSYLDIEKMENILQFFQSQSDGELSLYVQGLKLTLKEKSYLLHHTSMIEAIDARLFEYFWGTKKFRKDEFAVLKYVAFRLGLFGTTLTTINKVTAQSFQ